MVEILEQNVARRAQELFAKGQSAMERNNLSYAMDMFAAALEIEPGFLKARNYLRAAQIKHFNDRGGKLSMNHLATLAALPGLIQGYIKLKTGKADQALAVAEKLMINAPLNPVIIRLLEQAAVAAEMPEVAVQALTAAREYYPDNVEMLVRLGELLAQTEQLAAAKDCLEKALELHPNDGKVLNALKNVMARETMSKGGWDEASREGGSYRSVIKDSKGAAVLEQESRAVQDADSLALLMKDAQEKLKHHPDNVNIRRQLATLYVQAQRFDDAMRTLDEAQRAGGSSDPHLDRAMAEVRLKRFDYEIEQARKNQDLDGVASRQAARDDFVLKNLQTQVERYPNDLTLKFEYGLLLMEREQLNEAIQQLQQAQRHPQHRLRAVYNLGLCFMRKGQYDMARENLEKAAAELPEMNDLKKEIYYNLGSLLEQQDHPAEALRFYKEIYQADIGFRDVAAKVEAGA
ncbi:MAG: tetratricopeptide repeat protein [Lentisphaerae bacterium]|nr:tetratricopeptide repeat protein [Lentisphaerota bacterium]